MDDKKPDQKFVPQVSRFHSKFNPGRGTIDDPSKKSIPKGYAAIAEQNDAPKPPELVIQDMKDINLPSNALKDILAKVTSPDKAAPPDMPELPSGPKPNLLESQVSAPDFVTKTGFPHRNPRGRAGIPNAMPKRTPDPTNIPSLTRPEAPVLPPTPPVPPPFGYPGAPPIGFPAAPHMPFGQGFKLTLPLFTNFFVRTVIKDFFLDLNLALMVFPEKKKQLKNKVQLSKIGCTL